MRLLDTDIIVDVMRGHVPAIQWLVSQSDRDIGIPGLVFMEVINGWRNRREIRFLRRHLSPYNLYWPTAADSDRVLATFTRFHWSHSLGILDALIAECAVGLGVPLCTFNVRHFRAVPGLVTEQPYQRI
jgi:predicted nucleic acid-binding protein